MRINIDYIDLAGKRSHIVEEIGTFALIKHLALAGQGYLPTLSQYTRMVGMFLHYIEYLRPQELSESRFSLPPKIRQDPTEKGNFSNLVGKGIADYLSKKLSGGKITHSYEGVMLVEDHPISGGRPDLYCVGDGSQFAIEAKGLSASTVSDNEMQNHKKQAESGILPVNFSIASVSYNLYEEVSCRYHDPFNDAVPMDYSLHKKLNKAYYARLNEFVASREFQVRTVNLGGHKCVLLDILGPGTPYNLLFENHLCFVLILELRFLLDLEDVYTFNPEPVEKPNFYLDTDGVGVGMFPVDL